jgi:hypothetical protein
MKSHARNAADQEMCTWAQQTRALVRTEMGYSMVRKAYLGLESTLVPFPQLSSPSFSLFSEVREFLNFGLVKPVDDRVLALLNMYALDLRFS